MQDWVQITFAAALLVLCFCGTGRAGDSGLELFEKVELSAPDPRDRPPGVKVEWAATLQQRRRWWSYQPVRKPAIPHVKNRHWSVRPVDRFILAKLEEAGFEPALNADRSTLIRRLSFVLTGLPSSPHDAFLTDDSPDAYERLVDRLLASPHFGEHWARHWMDVAGYTDTYSYENNLDNRGAWRYRDYLIRAFNDDVSFDQLIREQIAGDLLPRPRWNAAEDLNESMIGPAFLQMGEFRSGDNLFMDGLTYEFLEHQIDNLTKAFQATTVACARCHDHKIDPVSMRDYYALAGVLMSARWTTRTIDGDVVNADIETGLRELKPSIRAELARLWNGELAQLSTYLLTASQEKSAVGDGSKARENLDPGRLEAWRTALAAEKRDLPMEHPLSPWREFVSGNSTRNYVDTWKRLSAQYEGEARVRTQFNREHFIPWADFRNGDFQDWQADGQGLRRGAVPSGGEFGITPGGEAAIGPLLPAGVFTHSTSEILNGALRSPLLPRDKKYVSVELLGDKYAAVRHVVDNGVLSGSRNHDIKQPKLHWRKLTTYADEGPRYRIYLELATKWNLPVFPYKGGLFQKLKAPEELNDPKYDFFREPRSYFGVTRVLLHDVDESPRDELNHLLPLFSEETPSAPASAAAAYQQLFQTALDAWANETACDDQIRLLNWLLDHNLLTNRVDASPKLRQLVGRYRELENRLSSPRIVDARADHGPGYNERVHLRGEVMNLGDEVPRGYLELVTGSRDGFKAPGSGRLQLAAAIATADNPLTARVIVNRIWHYLFGSGIVTSTDDFGRLGERPSHPELLDYLATRFVEDGWSIKQLIRRLVLSQTFRQSSRASPRAKRIDPSNRLLSHFTACRLEAESIRDAMLAVSGRIDRRLYGMPIQPFRRPSDMKLKLLILSGPLDGYGRRSAYTKIEVMAMPSFLAAFDQPLPRMTRGQRDVTNRPQQALARMNDPFVHAMADCWAKWLIKQPDVSIEDRLNNMTLRALGRPLSKKEGIHFRQWVAELGRLHGVSGQEVLDHHDVWKDVAHSLFNLSEFVYIQ